MLDLMVKCAELMSLTLIKGRFYLIEVKYCKDTRPGHQLEASNKQHESLCKLSGQITVFAKYKTQHIY